MIFANATRAAGAIFVAAAIAYVARRTGRDVIEELWPGSDRGLRVILTLARESGRSTR